MSEGLAGGYPGAPNSYVWVASPAGEGPVAGERLADLPGEHRRVSWGVYPLKGRDALYVRWNGGGGWGDPLARDPARVEADLADGLATPEAARAIYGVVPGDAGATDALRARLRADRMAEAGA
jgi:N-methylhydantoinase B